jgi:5'-nucleotidase
MAEKKTDPWILVTNDDGADSPALLPLLKKLSELAPLHAVVPSSERSWSAKILSRFEALEMRPYELAESPCPICTLSGYPADCANAGIYNLCSAPPALAVTGINVGANVGQAYFFSSGTVGAAIESALGGVPSVAFSLQLNKEDYRRWRQYRDPGPTSIWQDAASVASQIVAEIWARGLPADADLLNVNMPPRTGPDTPRRFATLSTNSYGRFFATDGPTGRLAYSGVEAQIQVADSIGDVETLARGEVALTPIRLAIHQTPAAVDRRRFERPSGLS